MVLWVVSILEMMVSTLPLVVGVVASASQRRDAVVHVVSQVSPDLPTRNIAGSRYGAESVPWAVSRPPTTLKT